MILIDFITVLLLIIGVLFFLAGTIGLLRLPDTHSRLHALTKADNVGLSFIILGLLFQVDSWLIAMKLLLIWILILVSSASISNLIANLAIKSDGK